MGVKISNLPTIATPSLTDIFPVVQSGVTYKESGTQFSTLFATSGANTNITSLAGISSITFTPTTGGIVGTTTNDNADAGKVGELIESTVLVASAVSLTNATPADVTSISLTAGDWNVWGNIWTAPAAGTTTSLCTVWISTTSATPSTAPGAGAKASYPYAVAADGVSGLPVGTIRLSLAAPTTVYLSVTCSFAVSTMKAYGYIGARRFR
jgi:hypothetical protein